MTVSARGDGVGTAKGAGGRWWPPGGGARSTGKRIFQKFGKESGARYLRVATSDPHPRRQYLARVGRIMPRTPVDASAPSVREMTRANVRARPAPSKPRSLPCPSTARVPCPCAVTPCADGGGVRARAVTPCAVRLPRLRRACVRAPRGSGARLPRLRRAVDGNRRLVRRSANVSYGI